VNTTARTIPSRPPLPPPRCGRCEFTSLPYERERAAGLLREYADRWRRVLARSGVEQPYSDTAAWSPLKHGCHVRDMCLLFHRQIDVTLSTAPSFAPVLVSPQLPPRYRDEDAGRVSEELGEAAEALAGCFARLTDDDWEREDARLPDLRLTVDSLTRYFLHDIVHDLSEALRRTHENHSGAVAHSRVEQQAAGPWLS
jgi:hypothetical protein